MRVDLPAPFSPINAWTSPGCTSKLTSSSTVTPLNVLVMFVIPRSGWGSCIRVFSLLCVPLRFNPDLNRGGRGGAQSLTALLCVPPARFNPDLNRRGRGGAQSLTALLCVPLRPLLCNPHVYLPVPRVAHS